MYTSHEKKYNFVFRYIFLFFQNSVLKLVIMKIFNQKQICMEYS